MAEPDRVDKRVGLWILCGLIVAAIVGAALLYVWASSYYGYQKHAPWIKAEMEEHPDGYLITIKDVEFQVYAGSWGWRIVEENSKEYLSGNLMDAVGVNLGYQDAFNEPAGVVTLKGDHNFFFRGKLQPGTQIIVSKELISTELKGMMFEIVFEPTNETMMSLTFKTPSYHNTPLLTREPTPIILVGSSDANLSFGDREPLSHNPILPYQWRKWSLTLTILNQGNQKYNNITFELGSNLSLQPLYKIDKLEIASNSNTTLTFNITSPIRYTNYTLGYFPISLYPRFLTEDDVLLFEGKIELEGLYATHGDASFSLTLFIIITAVLMVVVSRAYLHTLDYDYSNGNNYP